MTNAIARWHSNARHSGSALEQAYADRMEAEMQEMAIQLHKVGLISSLIYMLKVSCFLNSVPSRPVHLWYL